MAGDSTDHPGANLRARWVSFRPRDRKVDPMIPQCSVEFFLESFAFRPSTQCPAGSEISCLVHSIAQKSSKGPESRGFMDGNSDLHRRSVQTFDTSSEKGYIPRFWGLMLAAKNGWHPMPWTASGMCKVLI